MGGGHLSLAHAAMWQMRGGARSLMLLFLGWLTHASINRVSPTMLAQSRHQALVIVSKLNQSPTFPSGVLFFVPLAAVHPK